MIKGLNHVAVAVNDLEATLGFLIRTCGARVIWRGRFENEGFESILVAIGEGRLELLGSLAPGSLIEKFVRNKGQGIHHVSFEVDRFTEVIGDFKAKGLKLMGEADTENFKAVFIHPQSMFGMLTEIIEPKGGWGT